MAYTTIDKHTNFFDTKLFTGTNGSGQTISGLNFQPDFVWIKHRTDVSNHLVFDAVRTAGKDLRIHNSDSEATQGDTLTAFTSDGFTLGTDSDVDSTGNVCSWNWKAGTTSGLSGGTITPTAYSINATSGFGIYKYTGNGTAGANIAHGLGKTPTMIWVKRLDSAKEWQIYHQAMGNGKWIEFTSAVRQQGTSRWNDTSPTSTLFYLGNDSDVNGSGGSFIAYVWCDVPGYSKMGFFKGNQVVDGAYFYTDFAPSFLLMKSTQSTEHWVMHDIKRSPYPNPSDEYLYPNLANAEASGHTINFLSNGIKVRTDNDQWNDDKEFMFMAFGQTVVGSNNVPCTAR